MNKCSACHNSIRYIEFLKWLNHFSSPLSCSACGRQLVSSEKVLFVYLLLVPVYFVANYIVERLIVQFDFGVVINSAIFLLLLAALGLIETYIIFRLWSVREMGEEQ